jgi:hypothetical protein
LARSATVSDLSTRHGVSRKFVYQQANKARHALDNAPPQGFSRRKTCQKGKMRGVAGCAPSLPIRTITAILR